MIFHLNEETNQKVNNKNNNSNSSLVFGQWPQTNTREPSGAQIPALLCTYQLVVQLSPLLLEEPLLGKEDVNKGGVHRIF